MKIKYIAKRNTYFDPGTEAFLVEEFSKGTAARFRGIRYGEMKIELCQFSEFEQVWVDEEPR